MRRETRRRAGLTQEGALRRPSRRARPGAHRRPVRRPGLERAGARGADRRDRGRGHRLSRADHHLRSAGARGPSARGRGGPCWRRWRPLGNKSIVLAAHEPILSGVAARPTAAAGALPASAQGGGDPATTARGPPGVAGIFRWRIDPDSGAPAEGGGPGARGPRPRAVAARSGVSWGWPASAPAPPPSRSSSIHRRSRSIWRCRPIRPTKPTRSGTWWMLWHAGAASARGPRLRPVRSPAPPTSDELDGPLSSRYTRINAYLVSGGERRSVQDHHTPAGRDWRGARRKRRQANKAFSAGRLDEALLEIPAR